MGTHSQNRQAYHDATRLMREGKAGQAASLVNGLLERDPADEVALSILGSALMKLNRMPDALAAFEKAVTSHPDSFAAHGDLGFALMTAGNPARAIESFETAVTLNAGFYQGWCCLGRLQFEAGAIDAARRAFARAGAADPFGAELREMQEALDAARLAAAEKVARRILSRQRGHPEASLALAHLASSVGAFEEAAAILSASIETFPCDARTRTALVRSFEETGDYARALEAALAAAALEPDNPAPWQEAGRNYGSAGRYEEALAAYDRALDSCGAGTNHHQLARANLQLLRGHMLKILGRQGESVEAYRASAAGIRGNGAAYWGLADLKTHDFSDGDLEAMRSIVADEMIVPSQRSQAAFALGKALEDRGSYDEAFRAYEQANGLRPDVPFDPDELRRSVEEIIAVFDSAMLARTASPAPGGAVPIFIVGLPRSGSTLIEQILASHSAIEGTMELINLPNLVRRIRIDGGKRKMDYPGSLATFDAAELAAYGRRYLEETALYRTGAPYFIDKMPTNFDKIGLIAKILPTAVVIDARRHPMDCGFSCFKQHFAGGHHFSYRLENIGHYYNAYLDVMDHWNDVLPGRVLCIRYETLVQDTEAVVRRLLAHCGLPFEEACLEFFRNTRPVRTASSEQVRQPIYRKGLGQYRKFERHLEPLAAALGPATLARFSGVPL